jgi:uncharacterized protein involved in exopolysaccharide biosynthesis
MLPGATTMSDLYAAILGSGRIRNKIIKKHNLTQIFKTKTMTDTYEQLDEITKTSVSPEGIIFVSVTWFDKQLAADIANSYIDELDKFNTQTAMTVGKRYRIFIEERLSETEDTLAVTEEALRAFQEKHHTVALDIEIQAAIETIAQLKSQIILFEVQKGAWASAGEAGNPYLYNINRELRALKKQLSKIEFGDKKEQTNEFGAGFSVPFAQLPEVSLEYARLFRDVKVQEAIYELLTQQYEQAKIMELKDTPTVQLLDRATPPEKRSFPHRTKIVILSAIFGLLLGIFGTFLLDFHEQLKKRPNEFKKWSYIYTKLKGDLYQVQQWIRKIVNLRKKR